jgi:Predicted membrane protein
MILRVLLALVIGILVGFFGIVPDVVSGNMDTLLMALLCLLLFIIGVDLSQNRNAITEIRRIGARLLFIPLLIAAGSIAGALVISLLIGLDTSYGMAIGAGFGWYSLSSALLAPISGGEIGIMALLTNVLREMLSIIMLPLVVRYLGKTAAVAPGGATTMDTTLPFVVKYAGSEMSILSFVSGVILSLMVVFLVPLLAGL